jgi:hypothetical protein
MQAVDPKISPEALSVASSAVLFALLEALGDCNVLDQGTIHAVVKTAMMGIGPRVQTPVGAEAGRLLEDLARRFPQR